jgi:ABC-type iron transport system FetAB ATPase subunit
MENSHDTNNNISTTDSEKVRCPSIPSEPVVIVNLGEHLNDNIQFQWRLQQQLRDLEKSNQELATKVKEADILKRNLKSFYNDEQLDLLCEFSYMLFILIQYSQKHMHYKINL